jgi:hypothetical protein
VSADRYAIMLHSVKSDDETQQATVIRSADDGETWHPMAVAARDDADEIAGALQWAADCRAAQS